MGTGNGTLGRNGARPWPKLRLTPRTARQPRPACQPTSQRTGLARDRGQGRPALPGAQAPWHSDLLRKAACLFVTTHASLGSTTPSKLAIIAYWLAVLLESHLLPLLKLILCISGHRFGDTFSGENFYFRFETPAHTATGGRLELSSHCLSVVQPDAPSASLFICRTLIPMPRWASLPCSGEGLPVHHQPFYRGGPSGCSHACTPSIPARRNEKSGSSVSYTTPLFLHTRWPAPPPGYAQTAPAASIFLRR